MEDNNKKRKSDCWRQAKKLKQTFSSENFETSAKKKNETDEFRLSQNEKQDNNSAKEGFQY